MERLTLALVMRAVADDYEDFDMIVLEVSRWAVEYKVTIPVGEIEDGLRKLIDLGLVQAYRLTPQNDPEKMNGQPPDVRNDDCYFYLTQRGKAELSAYEDVL